MNNIQRIFIVGTPRSGTTLIQTAIYNLGDITTFPESHFFRYIDHERRNSALFLSNLYTYLKLVKWSIKIKSYKFPSIAFSRKKLIKAYQKINDNKAKKEKHQFWLEKTPSHLYSIKTILKNVPNSKIIIVNRDIHDTCLSLKKVANKWYSSSDKRDLDFNLARCIFDSATIISYENNPHCHIVNYEDFTKNPVREIEKISSFINKPLTKKPTEKELLRSPNNIIEKHEKWKENNLKNYIENKEKPLDKEIINKIERILAYENNRLAKRKKQASKPL